MGLGTFNWFMLDVTYLQLALTLFFTTLATYYYAYALISLRRRGGGSRGASLTGYPHVTIILPTYNERRVLDRLLRACVNIDYPSFDIIVADDSSDPETIRILDRWASHSKVRVVRRRGRRGFKAGAINNALKYLRPETRYIVIFDADYLPPRDVIRRMLGGFRDRRIAVVQAYTSHTLNAVKNSVTKGVRAQFSMYCRSLLPARVSVDGLVPIMGSAFMIRRDVLEELGGFDDSSITEDWELTLRLYMNGYRVFFLEDVVIPAECPNTFRDYVRQQMRWVEGIMRDSRRNLIRVLSNRRMSWIQKLDFVFQGFYGLYSIIAVVSFVSGAIQSVVGGIIFLTTGLIVTPPLWINVVMNLLGIYNTMPFVVHLYIGLKRDGESLSWLVYGSALFSALFPFLAYSSLKGLLSNKGSWIVTPKHGEILRRIRRPVPIPPKLKLDVPILYPQATVYRVEKF